MRCWNSSLPARAGENRYAYHYGTAAISPAGGIDGDEIFSRGCAMDMDTRTLDCQEMPHWPGGGPSWMAALIPGQLPGSFVDLTLNGLRRQSTRRLLRPGNPGVHLSISRRAASPGRS